MEPLIRFAQPEDAAEIAGIYAPYVLETTVTFEYRVPEISEMARRIEEISRDFPYLVYISDGKIEGYAYASRHHERAAYGWDAELSVYVDRKNRKSGIGSALYKALLNLIGAMGYYTAYAAIALPNEDSVRFHEALGFSPVCTFYKTGNKFGRWLDVLWMDKRLKEPEDGVPKPVINIRQLDHVKAYLRT